MSIASRGMIRAHSSSLGLVYRGIDAVTIGVAQFMTLRLACTNCAGDHYDLALAWTVLIFLTCGSIRQLYVSWRVETMGAIARAVGVAWLWTVIALVGLAFFTKTSADFSRAATAVWVVVTPALLLLVRWVIRLFLRSVRSAGANSRTLAIAGKNNLGKQVLAKIQSAPWLGLSFVGYYDDRVARREGANHLNETKGAGTFDQLIERAKAGEIDYVYITLPMKAEQRIVELVDALADTTASVHLVPDFFVFDLLHGKLMSLDGIPVVSLFESPFYGVDGLLKRIEDIVVASLILLLISLPMLVIAAGVTLSSPGPVLFKQRRYGLNGKTVEVWKFRSMTVTENGSVVQQATKNDARITPFGAFMRRTSLDELPQFFNVLQGSMSVVGPRPHAVAHNEEYRGLIRGYMLRHTVKPGITGWAQINGWRGETETVDKMAMRVKYDLDYVQNWSLWLDVKIIFLTVFKGFVHKNAY